MSDEIQNAMQVIRDAMVKDKPEDKGSYAHSWHCNIAMMCYDEIMTCDEEQGGSADDTLKHEQAHKIGNDAASRFMKLCFDVETSA